MTLRVLDLFSGIGGFSLGLERAGMRTVAFCEIDPYCRAVLRKHWPNVPCFDDVRSLSAADLPDAVDVVCGGFPCQDISTSGKGAGIDGQRSGLWREFARLIGELRPRYAIVENVAALTFRGLLRVLGDFTEIGYDAEWHCIPASVLGAPHERDRIWIVAYPNAAGLRQGLLHEIGPILPPETRRGRYGYPIGKAWNCEPELAVLVHGFPDDVAGAEAIGNSLVPAIPELIGRAIIKTAATQDVLTWEQEADAHASAARKNQTCESPVVAAASTNISRSKA